MKEKYKSEQDIKEREIIKNHNTLKVVLTPSNILGEEEQSENNVHFLTILPSLTKVCIA